MSNKIKVAEEILDLVPQALKDLEVGRYRLTKTENFRTGFIYEGDSVTGDLEIVATYGQVKPGDSDDLKPGVRVVNDNYHGGNDNRYIRTSPVVKVVDQSENSVTFQTEGGIYKLEKL